MALPDASRLLELSPDRWRALGQWLRSTGIDEIAEKVTSIAGQVFEPMCRPLRRWHLRRSSTPGALIASVLMTHDVVGEDALRDALPGPFFDELVGAGLLERAADGRVRSGFVLHVIDDVMIVCDELRHGGDAVMGAGSLTRALLIAAMPAEGAQLESALELGCGAAMNALLLSRHARRVVATDITERAVILGKVNAALNGVDNVELRRGDLFEPVEGETFDRIVVQPPFIPMPDDADAAAYMYGGPRGDELAMRVLGAAARHLSPRGRALVMLEVLGFDGDRAEDRVYAAIPPDTNVLLVKTDGPDFDAFSVGDAAHEHPDFGPAYEATVIRRREHLERIGARDIVCILAIIERADGPGWRAAFELDELNVEARTIDSLVSGFSLLASGRDALLKARLRPRPGLTFAVGKESARILSPRGSAVPEVQLDLMAHRLVEIVGAAPTVEAALKRFGKEIGVSPQVAGERFLGIVESLVRSAVVEIAS